jgi:hypothetical protein
MVMGHRRKSYCPMIRIGSIRYCDPCSRIAIDFLVTFVDEPKSMVCIARDDGLIVQEIDCWNLGRDNVGELVCH